MEKKEYSTDIIFVIDESGSMNDLSSDTIGGYNSYLKSQKNLGGKARITTVLFNDKVNTFNKGIDINNAPNMSNKTYIPSGSTALYDAIGDAIDIEETNISDGDAPDITIFVIITDGQENSSTRWNKTSIKSRLLHLQSAHKWKVIFTGANIDSFAEASNIGINAANSVNYTYTSQGVSDLYKGLSFATCSARTDGVIDENWKNEVSSSRNI